MSAPEGKNQKPRPSGRVSHDSGRAVWEWAKESGRHAIESTSRLLKKLDLAGLSIADDDKDPPPPPQRDVPTFGGERESDPLASARRSFDPYDNRAPPKRGAARPTPKSTAPRITQPPRDGRKPGLLARLFGRKY